MLHVDPGTAARRLVLWSEAMQESELCATQRVTRWSWSVAKDALQPFVASAATHCGRVGCITRPTWVASVVGPSTERSRSFVRASR